MFDPTRFEPPAFWNGVTYLKSKTNLVNIDDGPVLSKFVTVRPTRQNRLDVWAYLK